MIAHALAAHGEGLARQLLGKTLDAQLAQLLQRPQRVLAYLVDVVDARSVAQPLEQRCLHRRIIAGDDLQAVPGATQTHIRIDRLEQYLQVLAQLADEALAYLGRLDSDFGEELDNEFHR